MLDRFNAALFLGLGKYLQQLDDHALVSPRIDLVEPIVGVQTYLELFYTTKFLPRPPILLKTSEFVGMSLHSDLTKLREKAREAAHANEPFDPSDIRSLKEKMGQFETVLNADLSRAFTYIVSQVGVLAVDSLIDGADQVFEGYRDRIPETAISDTREAGRSIAFNLPTAAGFHIARATEAVLLKYMNAFGQSIEKESQRNWGKYTDLMRSNKRGANEKVLATIDQIRKLHRNPLLHPEETLIMPEALNLWAICCSAIQAMVADMEHKQVEPNAEILRMVPLDDSDEKH